MSDNCIFCKIIKRELPASIFYEDEEILGFMNHRPVHPPECLFIPKEHIDHFMDINDVLAQKIIKLSQQLSRFIRKKFNPDRVGYVVAGYTVAHAHLIVIPQYHENDITCEHFAVKQNDKIIFTDEHIPIAPREELDSWAADLKNFLEN
jgi:histidine triad (HIT) family protein